MRKDILSSKLQFIPPVTKNTESWRTFLHKRRYNFELEETERRGKRKKTLILQKLTITVSFHRCNFPLEKVSAIPRLSHTKITRIVQLILTK